MNLNRKKYMLLYLFIVGFLFFHLLIAKLYSEPYPSFVFPSFAKVEPLLDSYDIPLSYIYGIDSNNDTLLLEKSEVFAKLGMIQADHILSSICKKEKYIIEHKIEASKHYTKSEIIKVLNERAAFISLLKANLKQLYPDKHFKSIMLLKGLKKYSLQRNALDTNLFVSEKTILKLL